MRAGGKPSAAELARQAAQIDAIHRQQPGAPAAGEPLLPMPTGTPNGRLHGRYANVQLNTGVAADGSGGTAVTLLCTEYDIEFTDEFADVTAHGDYWRQRLPITQDWTGRIQGYFTATGAAAATYLHAASNKTGVAPGVTIWAYSDMQQNPLTATSLLFKAVGYVSRSRYRAPFRAMVNQEFEVVSASGVITI